MLIIICLLITWNIILTFFILKGKEFKYYYISISNSGIWFVTKWTGYGSKWSQRIIAWPWAK
jgi:hypothetical protein